MALGILTKGPIALLLPLGVAGAYAVWRRRGPALWSLGSLALGILLVTPWIIATERSVPGFLRYALVEESWSRVTTDQFQRTGPPWYFLPILAVGAFPWILPAAREIAVIWRSRAQVRSATEAGSAFAAIWLLAPLVLLSLSQSKRPQYMLPLLPAVAVLAAKRWRHGADTSEARWAALLQFLTGSLMVGLASLLNERLHARDPALADAAPALARLLGATLIVAGIAAWGVRRQRPWAAVAALALPAMLLPLLARTVVRVVSEGRSSRALVRALAPELAKGPPVIGINTFVPSLPFYLGRSIVLSAETPISLTSRSMLYFEDQLRKAHPEVLRPADWWQERLRSDAQAGLFLVLPGRQSEPPILEAAGLSPLFANQRLLVYGKAPGGLP
jgi:4-amino-4-deoxy-L-arabinose transferase-like glycosyltransferase